MSHRLQVSVTDEDAAAIAEVARRERLSQSSWARTVIVRELQRAIVEAADAAPPLTDDQIAVLTAAGFGRRKPS